MLRGNVGLESNMKKSLIVLILGVSLTLILFFIIDLKGSNNPNKTLLYCIDDSSTSIAEIGDAIRDASSQQGLYLVDVSEQTTRELDRLKQPRPEVVLHGSVFQDRVLVATYSNLGANELVFHISFFGEKSDDNASLFDKEISSVSGLTLTKAVSGGEFNDSLCGEF